MALFQVPFIYSTTSINHSLKNIIDHFHFIQRGRGFVHFPGFVFIFLKIVYNFSVEIINNDLETFDVNEFIK